MPSSAGSEAVEEYVPVLSEGLALEGRLAYPAGARALRGAALLCPPHPFLGGDMSSNVLREIVSALVSAGCAALAFNYRGIGLSQSHADLAAFEKEFWERSTSPAYEEKIFVDSAAALGVLEKAAGEAELFLVGYSFGSLAVLDLALKEARRVRKVVCISPPLAKWELKEGCFRARQDKAFFYSPDDFACPEDRLTEAYARFAPPKSLFRIEGSSHFFVGREKELARAVASFLVPAA
jgi:alpha/beta superfamily hydrolase